MDGQCEVAVELGGEEQRGREGAVARSVGACCNSFSLLPLSRGHRCQIRQRATTRELYSDTLLYAATAAAACISLNRSLGSLPFHRSTPRSSVVRVGRPNCSMM